MSLKSLLFRLALVLPTVIFLVLLEIGARGYAYYQDTQLSQRGDNHDEVAENAELSLRHIIRWNEHPKIIYELIPSLSGRFRDTQLSVNRSGMRGHDTPLKKPVNSLRIVGIGDSVMFGWGVADYETYMHQLEEQLIARHPNKHIDTINSAVPGYNTVSEVAVLEAKLLKYQPDIVILDYVRNDLDLPGFLKQERPYWSLRRSFLVETVRSTWRGVHVPVSGLQRPRDAFGTSAVDPREIPAAYRDLVGLGAMQQAVNRLQALAIQHEFSVIAHAHFGFATEPKKLFAQAGFELVDGYPETQRYLRANDITQYSGSVLTISDSDPHPSVLHHQLIAARLANHISARLRDDG